MAEAPIMPFATDAYLGDTTHLSTLEHGAYFLLLITMWRAGGSLPNDPKILARYCRLTPGQFKRSWQCIGPFFYVEGGELKQGKLTEMLEAVRQKSKSGKHGARAKWRKYKEQQSADAESRQSETPAIHDPVSKKGKTKVFPKKYEFPDFIEEDAADGFIAYRERIGKPPSERAFKVLCKALGEIKAGGGDASAALDMAVLNEWGGFQAEWYWNAIGKKPGRVVDLSPERRAELATAIQKRKDDEAADRERFFKKRGLQ